jgi:acyl carrier protein
MNIVNQSEIKSTVKDFMLKEFLPGENPDDLENDTPLVSGGILDSIAILKLVTFLEDTYSVSVQPHEVSAENLESLNLIEELVQSKL